jgi:opacity protein-like surface antigen
MPAHTIRFFALQIACFVLFALMLAGAQAQPVEKKNDGQNTGQQNHATSPATPGADYSGIYSFLQEGEFVQITVEDQGRVIGFVSRYAAPEIDAGFLEHFFKSGKLDGNRLAFSTETVQGVSYEFHGTVERGEGKSRADEAYYVLEGTLVENTTGDAKKTSSHSREVVLKSFPQDLVPPPMEKK